MHEKELSDFAQQSRALATQISPGPIRGAYLYNLPTLPPDATELRGIAAQLVAVAAAIEAYLRPVR
jgi:hypothetical protein